MEGIQEAVLVLLEGERDADKVAGLLLLAHTVEKLRSPDAAYVDAAADCADADAETDDDDGRMETYLLAAVDTVGLRFIGRMLLPSSPPLLVSTGAHIVALLASLATTPASAFPRALLSLLLTHPGRGTLPALDSAIASLPVHPHARGPLGDALLAQLAEAIPTTSGPPADLELILGPWDAYPLVGAYRHLPPSSLSRSTLVRAAGAASAILAAKTNPATRARVYALLPLLFAAHPGSDLISLATKLAVVDARVVLEAEVLKQSDPRVSSLPRVLALLEAVISLVLDEASPLDDAVAGSLVVSLLEAMNAVVYYINAVAFQGQTYTDLMGPAIRVLGAWLAEENDILVPSVIPILPLMFDRSRRARWRRKHGHDWLIFLLAGLRSLLANSDAHPDLLPELLSSHCLLGMFEVLEHETDHPIRVQVSYFLVELLLPSATEPGTRSALRSVVSDHVLSFNAALHSLVSMGGPPCLAAAWLLRCMIGREKISQIPDVACVDDVVSSGALRPGAADGGGVVEDVLSLFPTSSSF